MTDKKQISTEDFKSFIERVSRFIKEDKILVKWGRDTLAIRPNIDLEEEFPDLCEKYTERELIRTLFLVSNILRDVANKKEIDKSELGQEKLQIILDNFLEENELLNHIRIHSSSTNNTFEDIDYAISIQKKSKKESEQDSFVSLTLSLFYSDSINPEENKRLALELTKTELSRILTTLQEALENID